MYILKEPEYFSFEKAGIKGKIFPTQDFTLKTSFVLVETEKGHETTIREKQSDFIYYVLEGEGVFVINDINEKCSRGDLIVIPAGTKFTYKGRLKLLLSCVPPWKEEQEETIFEGIKI